MMFSKSRLGALMVALILAPTPGLAQGQSGEMCQSMAAMAVTVMESRQLAVPRQALLELVSRGQSTDRVFQALVVEAYARPIEPDPVGQAAAVRDFGAAIEATCLKAVRGIA